jgi:hypothetical protein
MQWHPFMLQKDDVPTAVFEVPEDTIAPDELRSYDFDYEVLGVR